MQLLWSSVLGLVIQILALRLGIVTRRHLAEHCRDEYPGWLRYILWFLSEIMIIASDVPEVIGTGEPSQCSVVMRPSGKRSRDVTSLATNGLLPHGRLQPSRSRSSRTTPFLFGAVCCCVVAARCSSWPSRTWASHT